MKITKTQLQQIIKEAINEESTPKENGAHWRGSLFDTWRAQLKEQKVKITKTQLRKIIKEEVQKEAHEGGEGVHDIFNLPEPEAVEPSGDPKVDALRQIVADKQYAKVDGVNIDMQTASLLLQILDGLNPQNRENFLGRPIEQMADIAYKILGKQ